MAGGTEPLCLPRLTEGKYALARRTARGLTGLIAPALIVAFEVAALTHPGAATSTAGVVVAFDVEEQQALELINTYRAEAGLPLLVIDPQLQAAARWMSEDMAANDYFSHDDSLGRDPFQRMGAFGYTDNVWKGENLAAGTSQAQVAFDLWRDSPAHDANMTSGHFRGVGIARAYGAYSGPGWYWTTDFGGAAAPLPEAEPTASLVPSPPPTATPSTTERGEGSFQSPIPASSEGCFPRHPWQCRNVRRQGSGRFRPHWRASSPHT